MKKRKALLEKKLNRLIGKNKDLKARADASEDVSEVRSILGQVKENEETIEEVREEIALIDEELRAKEQGGETLKPDELLPEGAQLRNGTIVGSFTSATTKPATENRDGLMQSETMEYRQAYRRFIQNNEPIPAELRTGDAAVPQVVIGQLQSRSGEAINAATTTAVIPLTIVREITNMIRLRVGQVYRRTRKIAVQGGVKFPVGEFETELHWITEKTVSPNQDLGDVELISFDYNVAEIRVAQTFLSERVSLAEFEAEIARAIATAFFKGMDEAVVSGSGNGAPLGLLNDPRVINQAGHVFEMTAEDISDWTKWQEFFSTIPLGYDEGEFIFTKGTVDRYLRTMKDDVNRPLYYEAAGMTVSSGDVDNPGGAFFGHPFTMVENFVLPDFASANDGDVVAIWWQPWEYIFNEQFGFTMRRYFDERENKWVTKLLLITDGKVLNPKGVYLIKKKV